MRLTLEDKFQSLLLNWYSQNARILPWRTNPSLYKTVVSEFMLQQTQVKTVLPYFERWMRLFPSFEALSEANESTVLMAWSGLGYYARAKCLHECARVFVKNPIYSYQGWLNYKGIGKYTAAAIASIAFNETVAVVDGNVMRVLCRLLSISEPFKTKDAALKIIRPISNQFLLKTDPGRYNEALMELGAIVCTKQKPRCDVCPVKSCCKSYQNNTVHLCPCFVQVKRTHCKMQRYWIRDTHSFLLEPSTVGRVFQDTLRGLLELPTITPQRMSVVGLGKLVFTGRRSIGTKDFMEQIYLPQKKVNLQALILLPEFSNCVRVTFDQQQHLAFTGPHKRWISKFLQ
jgi:A/G-specific adenine glycosylase